MDTTDKLYRAVIAFVKSNGGHIIIIGGVEVQQWPEDGNLNFKIAIRCTGKKPCP